jgi:hypothetical protein
MGMQVILTPIFPEETLQSEVNNNERDWSLILNNLLTLHIFLQLPKNLEYKMSLSATERSRMLAEIIAYCLLLTHAHDAQQFYFISSYIKDVCIYLAKALSDVQHILDDILVCYSML